MENFERDMERSRLKKDVTQDLKSRWAVLLVNSTGKVYTISYLKAVLIAAVVCFGLLTAALAITVMIASHSLKESKHLNLAIEACKTKNLRLMKENENLSARIALFDAASPVKEVKKEVVKKDETQEKSNLDKHATPLGVKNKEIQIKKEVKKSGVEIKNYSILKNENNVWVVFDIVNINSSDGPVSGYIFAILENEAIHKKEVIISPYSVLSSGRPVNPTNGQYFSISRFKHVKLKFVGNINLSRFNNVKILVYQEDKKLLLEKGFKINEKN